MIRSMFQPMLIRWHKRNECPCELPAKMRCSRHGSKLCGSEFCVAMHRHFHHDEFCVIQALRGPLDYSLYALAVVVVALTFVLGVLYMGVRI